MPCQTPASETTGNELTLIEDRKASCCSIFEGGGSSRDYLGYSLVQQVQYHRMGSYYVCCFVTIYSCPLLSCRPIVGCGEIVGIVMVVGLRTVV